ncbi:MAG: response regulator, partial [Bacteroidota bacterium]
NGETVLVIDDEVVLVEIATISLELSGYKVISASDGIEGIQRFLEYKDTVSAVVCDWNMPHMGGNSAIQSILYARPDMKIIIVSGSMEFNAAEHLPGSTNAIFLQKPYRSEKLLEALHYLLNQESVVVRK